MEKLIVVGVDGSLTAAASARRGAELARATGCALHVVSAYAAEAPDALRDGGDHARGESEADVALRIARGAAEELASLVPQITSAAVRGTPADALVSEAERLNASIIVVGNRRVQGIARVLGSVAGGVAHHAPCDVFVVHTH
ncbi:universal stress protein [Georgenia ruanii]|uniref:Universal stress protein n=1 Tax=Georgenia ruanii TaxID=348442 RepID=A0A7J9UVR6_9MICO|nr:universal stress protein [Georgenia ruanii]MPV88463.1 universal stress protein [Georgenia ruanii]